MQKGETYMKTITENNLGKVWECVAEKVKTVTGDVNVPKDGNLLTQLEKLKTDVGDPQKKTELLDKTTAAAETDTLPIYSVADGESRQITLKSLAESLNITKLELFVHTCTGAKVTCTNGVATLENTGSCKFNLPDTGIWTVTCSHKGKSVSKTVEIYLDPRTDLYMMILDHIEVTTPPAKTLYEIGDTFDPTGAVVIATYTDGTAEEVTSKCTWDKTTMAAGMASAEATYELLGIKKTASTPVVVRSLESLKITTPPTKTDYLAGETFEKAGMKVQATYADGSAKEIPDYTYTPTGKLTDQTYVTISYTEKGVTKTVQQPITVEQVHIYGVAWGGTSSTKWSRTDDSALFTDPVPYVKGASSYGSPFDNLQPWAGMKKVERGPEFIKTMVSIPKFWYKLMKNGSGIKVQIADHPQPGFSTSPAHMDRGDGKGERDVVYVSRRHGDANSLSDVLNSTRPVNAISRSAARTKIHSLGDTFWQFDYAMWFTIQLLYLVEYADWNSQEKIGYGCGNGEIGSMGASDSMPYHTGTMQTSRTTYGVGVQYRYIEDLWGNVFDWLDGCYYNSNGLNIILNPANFSDTSNGIAVGTPSSGYPSNFDVKTSGPFPVLLPTSAGGSTVSYSADVWYFYSSIPCLYTGGSYCQYLDYGLFYVHCSSASSSSSNIGCRLQELP